MSSKNSPFDFRSKIPVPPHPIKRSEPLPWQRPKPSEDDPGASHRVQALLHSPTYIPAEDDKHFMERDELRGVRLQIEYLKPEILLEQHRIRHTIVVYGSTRICEPTAARRNLARLHTERAANPDSPGLKTRIKIAEQILEKSRFYDVAREFGQLVSRVNETRSDHNRLVIMTGGGPGIMEAANRGAFDVGAKNVGLNISLPHEQYPNPYITPELCFSFHYFALRKMHLLLRARALIVFPGGYGTFDEMFEVLTLIQTRKIKPIPVILVGEAFWRRAIDMDFMVDEGVIDREDRELFWFAESADEIWNGILHWHDASGEPLDPRAAEAPANPKNR